MTESFIEKQRDDLEKIARLVLFSVPEKDEEDCLSVEMKMHFDGNLAEGDKTAIFRFSYDKENDKDIVITPFWDVAPENHFEYIRDIKSIILQLRELFIENNNKSSDPVWTGIIMKISIPENKYRVTYTYQ